MPLPLPSFRVNPVVEGKGWIDVARTVNAQLGAAVKKGRGGEAFCQRVAGVLPPAVQEVLWNGVAEGDEIKLHQVGDVARSLGIRESQAERILERWQWALNVGSFAVTALGWERTTVSLRRLIFRRLRMAFIGGALLAPRLIGQSLEREAPQNHPAVVTFHNVVEGTERDLPRFFRMHLASAFQVRGHYELLGDWEDFWEREAAFFLWDKKPIYRPPVGDILGAMEYAWQMQWSLERFREWLIGRAPLTPSIPFVDIFDALIDREVLEGRSQTPKEREREADLRRQHVHRTRFFGTWEKKFGELAEALGRPDAIRPVSNERTQFARSREMEVTRRRIFQEAKERGLSVQELYQALLANGLTDDARMLANVCEGIDLSARVFTNHLRRDHLSLSGMHGAEKKYKAFAIERGWPMKEKK